MRLANIDYELSGIICLISSISASYFKIFERQFFQLNLYLVILLKVQILFSFNVFQQFRRFSLKSNLNIC